MALDDWLTWEAGEKKEVLIQSDKPVKKLVHWTGETYADCERPDCPWCDDKVKRITRYAVEAVSEDDVWTWEMAGLVWKALKDVAEEYGGLRGLHLKVKRTGEGRKTRYTLIPLGQMDLDEAEDSLWDRGAIARDPKGAAVFVKELSASLEMTAKEAMAKFLADEGQEYVEASGLDKLGELIRWLHLQCAVAAANAEEDTEIDLDSLFT